MLSAQVREAVATARPAKKLAMLVYTVPASLPPTTADGKSGARKETPAALYRRIKRPLIKTFSEYESSGITVINGLEGTPGMIVSGPVKAWRQFLDDQPKLVSKPNLEFRMNGPSWSAPES